MSPPRKRQRRKLGRDEDHGQGLRRAFLDVRARLLRRHLRHQSVDGPGAMGQPRARLQPNRAPRMEKAASEVAATRRAHRAGAAGSGIARSGLHRQRGRGDGWGGAARPFPTWRAAAGRSALGALFSRADGARRPRRGAAHARGLVPGRRRRLRLGPRAADVLDGLWTAFRSRCRACDARDLRVRDAAARTRRSAFLSHGYGALPAAARRNDVRAFGLHRRGLAPDPRARRAGATARARRQGRGGVRGQRGVRRRRYRARRLRRRVAPPARSGRLSRPCDAPWAPSIAAAARPSA